MQNYKSFNFLDNDEVRLYILELVHDRVIDLDDACFNEEAHQLTLPLTVVSDISAKTSYKLGFLKYKHYPIYAGTLIIDNVNSWKAHDPDEIRTCMINYINLNESDFEIVGATSSYVKGIGDNIKISLRVFSSEIDEEKIFIGFF